MLILHNHYTKLRLKVCVCTTTLNNTLKNIDVIIYSKSEKRFMLKLYMT